MNKQFWTRSFIAAAVLLIVDLAFSPTQSNGYSLENTFWDTISNLMISVTMNLVVIYSGKSGFKLVLSLWLISFGTGSFNILIEAWIFNVTNTIETALALLKGIVKFGVMALALTYLYPYSNSQLNQTEIKRRSIPQWLWRIGVGIMLYLFVYIAAGIVLQASLPAIAEYYSGKMPGLETVIYTQVFRGLIFVVIAIFLQQICAGSTKSKQVVLIGLIFSILGGVAPLIPPNNLMPAIIRLGHGFEVGISNFIYGCILGMMLHQRVNKKTR